MPMVTERAFAFALIAEALNEGLTVFAYDWESDDPITVPAPEQLNSNPVARLALIHQILDHLDQVEDCTVLFAPTDKADDDLKRWPRSTMRFIQQTQQGRAIDVDQACEVLNDYSTHLQRIVDAVNAKMGVSW